MPLRAGEILGLGGLIGAGRTELARVIFGIDPPAAGTLRMGGQEIRLGSPRDAIDARHLSRARGPQGVRRDPRRSDRVQHLAGEPDPLRPGRARQRRGGTRQRGGATQIAAHQGARRRDPDGVAQSGGNQQKVVLGKWLCMDPKVMIFDEPTRGIDVGSKSEIYALMRALADRGVAILMISSDMEEVIGVSDRVAVMHEGAITGVLDRDQMSEAAVMRLAVGATSH